MWSIKWKEELRQKLTGRICRTGHPTEGRVREQRPVPEMGAHMDYHQSEYPPTMLGIPGIRTVWNKGKVDWWIGLQREK